MLRLVGKARVHRFVDPWIPYCASLPIRPSRGTLSMARLKSRIPTSVWTLVVVGCAKSSLVDSRMNGPSLKPWCRVVSKWSRVVSLMRWGISPHLCDGSTHQPGVGHVFHGVVISHLYCHTRSVYCPYLGFFLFGIPAPKPLSENKTTKFRRWKSLDLDAFKSDLSNSDMHLILESNSMSDAVTTYTILQDLIDKHAPEYDCTFKPRHHTPWYNSTVRGAKRLRRRLERRWRKTQSEPDREAYRSQCQVVRDELVKAKSEHYHNKLSEADNHKDVIRS